MNKPAARVTDTVAHPLPPILTGGTGSLNVLIGNLPAWRGMPLSAVTALKSAKAIADTTIKTAEAATVAAAGTPGAPAAVTAEQTAKTTAATSMGAMIRSAAGGADIHACTTPSLVPPHGEGSVISGSQTVLINGLPASRMGDEILEALGKGSFITNGCPTVLIGG